MSMTGYGKDEYTIGDTIIYVEIRTLNHRYLDISLLAPRSIRPIEDRIKKAIKTYFSRGSTEVHINIESKSHVKKQLEIDWKLMDQYFDQVEIAKRRYNLTGHIPLEALMTLSDLFTISEVENKQSKEVTKALLHCIKQACERVYNVREKEGAFIGQDIQSRMDSITTTIIAIEKRSSLIIEQYRKRIYNRIKDYLANYSQVDETRIQQEVILLAEKGDITEELKRLLSHSNHFYSVLEEPPAMGRKLDFIVQEMHREINTIGAKSVDIKVSESIVILKNELEKIREQIQNIE